MENRMTRIRLALLGAGVLSQLVWIAATGYFTAYGQRKENPPRNTANRVERIDSEPIYARVKLGDQYGFIDRTGAVVRAGNSDDGDFSEGLAKIRVDGKYGYIDKRLKVVIEPRFSYAGDFHEGLAAVRTSPKGKAGFIDKSGKLVIPEIFDGARHFSEGLAHVNSSDMNGYIDASGRIAINLPRLRTGITWYGDFKEGLALFSNDSGNYGFIDKTGKIVIQPQFFLARNFSEGLSLVEPLGGAEGLSKTGEYIEGFIDKTGAQAIKPEQEGVYFVESFAEGLAHIRVGSPQKSGFIDKTGRVVIKPQFKYAGFFSNGLAVIQDENDKYGYIDKAGKIVIKPQFDRADVFK